MLVKAGLISALGCMLVLMLPVITLEKGTNVALGEATREITEFAGLYIADEAAKNWNPDAELVEIDGWMTVLREYQDGTFELVLTGWQYYYRAGGEYLKVSMDVDSYDRGTVSSTEEPTQTEIQFIERVGVGPLTEWYVSGPNAVDIASADYDWSLENGDDLSALYLLMPDTGADSIPVWYISIKDGSSGVETDYLVDAKMGVIIPSSDDGGTSVKQITEYAGLNVADSKASSWDSGAQLIRVKNWKTSVVETVASGSSELLTTGWQYYYRAGARYYVINVDIDSIDSSTFSSAWEMTGAEAESAGLVGLEALSEWNVSGPSAIKIAAYEYDMSLERDDELSGLCLAMADVDGDSRPVWYASITNGQTGVETGYEINAVTGEIIVSTGDALLAVAISVSIVAVLMVITGGVLVRRYYAGRPKPVGEEVMEEVVPVSPLRQPSIEDVAGTPVGEALAAPVAPSEQPAVEEVPQPPVEEAVAEPVVPPAQPAVEGVQEPRIEEAPSAPPAGEAANVFVSHVEEDAEIALEITLGLEEAGYSTWCYEVDILPGLYLTQVEHAVGCCPVFLLVISPDSLGSNQVTNELVRAYEDEKVKHFIPVLRDITDAEFKKRQPLWRQCVGAATSLTIPPGGINRLIPRVLGGLKAMGIQPRGEPDVSRLTRIREELDSLRRSKKSD
jgi:hypothetical protein